jgi:N-methylhydantoinase A
MVNALNLISVEQGIDPREFTLVAFGGAGALHAAGIAEILGIERVLVPPYPGNTSAFGLLTAGLRSDLATTLLIRSSDEAGREALNRSLEPLRERAVAALAREGHRGEPVIEQRLEMRYFGQNHHREIAIAPDAPLDAEAYAAAFEAFHRDHLEFYGYEQRADVVEIVGVVVTATGERPGIGGRFTDADRELALDVTRPVYFGDTGWQDVTIVQREGLEPGSTRNGPLVVEERLSTTLVPPGAQLTVHASGSLLIDL